MIFKRFPHALYAQLLLLFLSMLGLVYFIVLPGYYAVSLIFALLTLACIWAVLNLLSKHNHQYSRLLQAANHLDFDNRLPEPPLDCGFPELSEQLTNLLQHWQEKLQGQALELKHAQAMIEHMPIPLVSIQGDDGVYFHNQSARRFFELGDYCKAQELSQFGEDFFYSLSQLKPGQQTFLDFYDGSQYRKLTAQASLYISNKGQEKLVSLIDIESELDRNQLQAWREMAAVLSHELLNSITPVASLADTSQQLLEDSITVLMQSNQKPSANQTQLAVASINDALEASQVLARRSKGLIEFVSNYRQLQNNAEVHSDIFALNDLLNTLQTLLSADSTFRDINLSFSCKPNGLQLHADRELIEQLMINLLRNSAQALNEYSVGKDQISDNSVKACVQVRAYLDKRSRCHIEVQDNGPGIKAEHQKRIFLPFYTSKAKGSGIGLAMARQIMVAHGGKISVHDVPEGGALFRLSF